MTPKFLVLKINMLILLVILLSGCTKKATDASPASKKGEVMFWISSDLNCGQITVTCGGVAKNITGYSSSTPTCGASGAATFSLEEGTYSYSAVCSGKSWSGTVIISAGNCNKIELTNNSTGGGGSGGGSTTGQVTFWTASNLNCGNITVSCNGESRIITNYSSTAPSCGTTGFATFQLPAGSHNYTASCNGQTWSGTVTATSGGCNRIELISGGNNGGGTGGGTGGGGSTPTVTLPNTQMVSWADYNTAAGGNKMELFTVSTTATYVFRFTSQFAARAAIIPQNQYNNFINGNSYTHFGQFNGTNGTLYVNLSPGTYYVGHRNPGSTTNKVSLELDRDIQLPASDRSTFFDFPIQGANTLSTNQRMWHAFTISSGYRYFIDGCNVNMNFYVIPANQLAAFQSGSTFQHYSTYAGADGNEPGLFELSLPPGSYYLVGKANAQAAYTYTMERWKVN